MRDESQEMISVCPHNIYFVLMASLIIWMANPAQYGTVTTQTMRTAKTKESAEIAGEGNRLPDGVLLRLLSIAPKDAPEGVPSSFSCVAYSPDGKMLATGGFYSPLRLWDTASGKHIRRFEATNGTISQVAFSPDGRLLASTGQDKIVHLW